MCIKQQFYLCDAHTKDRHRDREQEERERESGVFLRERKKQEVRNCKRVCVCIWERKCRRVLMTSYKVMTSQTGLLKTKSKRSYNDVTPVSLFWWEWRLRKQANNGYNYCWRWLRKNKNRGGERERERDLISSEFICCFSGNNKTAILLELGKALT